MATKASANLATGGPWDTGSTPTFVYTDGNGVPSATSSITKLTATIVNDTSADGGVLQVVEAPEDEELSLLWEGVLAVEGHPTDDRRYLMPGYIEERELPLTLMAQFTTAQGHMEAHAAGKITRVWREPRPDLGENAVAVMGAGEFDDGEVGGIAYGRDAARLVRDEVLRGVSIDFAPSEVVLLNAETYEPIEGDADLVALVSGDVIQGMAGKIMGATLLAFAAFEEAVMRIVPAGDGGVLVSSAFGLRLVPESLTAAAAGRAPLKPPKDWFFTPEAAGPCPLTVTDDGLVFGHLATWNQCHTAFPDRCELAPKSRADYKFFHLGEIETAEGEKVAVGRVTVGNGHFNDNTPSLRRTVDHYDKTGMVAAFVRAINGKHGIWLSGAIRSDCPAEKIRDLRANPPSGDWRRENGNLELVAALAVPVPGFPVPRTEYAMVASGSNEEVVEQLVATGFTVVEPAVFTRAGQRRLSVLRAKARAAIGA